MAPVNTAARVVRRFLAAQKPVEKGDMITRKWTQADVRMANRLGDLMSYFSRPGQKQYPIPEGMYGHVKGNLALSAKEEESFQRLDYAVQEDKPVEARHVSTVTKKLEEVIEKTTLSTDQLKDLERVITQLKKIK